MFDLSFEKRRLIDSFPKVQLQGLKLDVLPRFWEILGEHSERNFCECSMPFGKYKYQALTAAHYEKKEFTGWIDLPEQMKGGALDSILEVSDNIAKEWDAVVVVGIGGSYLGAKALQEALVDHWEGLKRPQLYFLGHTLCSSTFMRVCRNLRGKRWGVVVISKSGTTLEPGVTFRMLRAEMERDEMGYQPSRVVVVTDAEHGALREMAKREGFRSFVLPSSVGGRYSVFTPVGLLPLAIIGVNIRELIEGASHGQACFFRHGSRWGNEAVIYAAIRNLMREKGYTFEFLSYYTPLLSYVGEWWKQLFGESEGKEGKGLLPVTLCYSTDLHSLGQFVQDGPRTFFETHLEIEQPLVENGPVVLDDEGNLDGLNYLTGKGLDEMNRAVCQAAQRAHEEGGVPSISISLARLDAYHLGLFFYFMEFSCALSAMLQKVNPFDQPGVEAYKQSMFSLLGRPGYGA